MISFIKNISLLLAPKIDQELVNDFFVSAYETQGFRERFIWLFDGFHFALSLRIKSIGKEPNQSSVKKQQTLPNLNPTKDVALKPRETLNLTPLGAWLSLFMIATTGIMGYSYYTILETVSTLKNDIKQLENKVSNTPLSTVDAIIAWNDSMQAQQTEEQARAQAQLQQGFATIDEEIEDIRAGEALSTSITNEHATIGSEEAKVVLIEFGDLNCGFCARYHAETLPKIIENYVNTGKIRYVYRDYIGVGGQVSQAAATQARCLREDVDDVTYLSYIRKIYAIQGRKDSNNIVTLAQEFGAGEGFEACGEEGRYAEAVQRDTTAGQQLGIRGTPGFIIGFVQEDGTVDGVNIQGALPYEVFENYLEGFLAAEEATSTIQME